MSEPKYEHVVLAKGFSVKVTPSSQMANVMNYLTTGYPLSGKSLDGVIVEFIEGEHKGKKAIFQTEMYEIEADDNQTSEVINDTTN